MLDLEPIGPHSQLPVPHLSGANIIVADEFNVQVPGMGIFNYELEYFTGLWGIFPPYINKNNYCGKADLYWNDVANVIGTHGIESPTPMHVETGQLWTVGRKNKILGLNTNWLDRQIFNFHSYKISNLDFYSLGETAVAFKTLGFRTGIVISEYEGMLSANVVSPSIVATVDDRYLLFDLGRRYAKMLYEQGIDYKHQFIVGRQLNLSQEYLNILYNEIYA